MIYKLSRSNFVPKSKATLLDIHYYSLQYCSDKPKNLMKLGSVGSVGGVGSMEERGGRVGSVGREWRKSCSLVLPFFSTFSILRRTFFSLSLSTDNFFNRTVLTSVVLLKRVAIIQLSQSRGLRGRTS